MSAPRPHAQVLRRERQAARLGRDLLDDKREAILRALLERTPRLAEARRRAAAAAADAQRNIAAARLENGCRTVAAAALAQPVESSVDWRHGSVVGVPTPRLAGRVAAFTPRYGAAPVTAKLDRAGEDFFALVTLLIAFAEEDEAVRNLQSGLSKTIRRLRALEQVVIPGLDRHLRDAAVAAEEEERDDATRHRLAAVSRRTSWPHERNATR
jgi:V/A-type H+-transporting ATPase subunit D